MKFNLHYYDGLANQDEDIILTIGELNLTTVNHKYFVSKIFQ